MRHALIRPVPEADYLAGELTAPVKHEYVAGQVFAMTGASKAHNVIALNIAMFLRGALRGTPCRTYIADVKVHVAARSVYYYPDVVVTCGARDLAPEAPAHYVEEPRLVVEVLSPATEAIDRREKLAAYQSLASLEEYVLVSQSERRLEVFRRLPDGWAHDTYAGDETADLAGLRLDLAAVYTDSGIVA